MLRKGGGRTIQENLITSSHLSCDDCESDSGIQAPATESMWSSECSSRQLTIAPIPSSVLSSVSAFSAGLTTSENDGSDFTQPSKPTDKHTAGGVNPVTATSTDSEPSITDTAFTTPTGAGASPTAAGPFKPGVGGIGGNIGSAGWKLEGPLELLMCAQVWTILLLAGL